MQAGLFSHDLELSVLEPFYNLFDGKHIINLTGLMKSIIAEKIKKTIQSLYKKNLI